MNPTPCIRPGMGPFGTEPPVHTNDTLRGLETSNVLDLDSGVSIPKRSSHNACEVQSPRHRRCGVVGALAAIAVTGSSS